MQDPTLDNILWDDHKNLEQIKSLLIETEQYELIKFVDKMVFDCRELIKSNKLCENKYAIFKLKMALLRNNSIIKELYENVY